MKEVCLLIDISLKLVPVGPRDNKSSLAQVMAWAITWGSDDPIYWSVHASPDLGCVEHFVLFSVNPATAVCHSIKEGETWHNLKLGVPLTAPGFYHCVVCHFDGDQLPTCLEAVLLNKSIHLWLKLSLVVVMDGDGWYQDITWNNVDLSSMIPEKHMGTYPGPQLALRTAIHYILSSTELQQESYFTH